MIEYEKLNADFISERFPELAAQAADETADRTEFLPHVVFGNLFNRLTVSLLKRGETENPLLHRIFDMYEELACGDEETQNLVQVTLLEYLWDEKSTYARAEKLLGERTKQLWKNIAEYLDIPLK